MALEKVDQTHLVLASAKPELQKDPFCFSSGPEPTVDDEVCSLPASDHQIDLEQDLEAVGRKSG